MASYRVLAVSADSKTIKGEALGYLTGILYLIPSDQAGDGRDVCPSASPGCRSSCLNLAGRGPMMSVQTGRARKRAKFFNDRAAFLADIRHDIDALVRQAKREGLIPAVRLNGTSDIAWELIGRELFAAFPTVQFYDYTKIAIRAQRARTGKLPTNYALTFSRSETNDRAALALLAAGANVSVVFGTKKGVALPAEWHGYRVVDGDASDLRFLDPQGVVVGLRAKGLAKRDASGFVVRETAA